MKDFTLEVCVDSVESAALAIQGGATRLELCSNLVIGGTTPSIFLYKEIRKFSDIPIHAIIRPRFGDFCNTQSELRIMADEVRQFRDEGVEGVVTGVLRPDGTIDTVAMDFLRKAAGGMHFVMHRAFDMSNDPFEAIKQAECLGVDTILTSGQKNICVDGISLIKKLVSCTDIDIMVGSGLTPDSIRLFRRTTGVSSFHLSGKVIVDSPMLYRNTELKMGLPSHSEFELWRTSAENIAIVRQTLEEID